MEDSSSGGVEPVAGFGRRWWLIAPCAFLLAMGPLFFALWFITPKGFSTWWRFPLVFAVCCLLILGFGWMFRRHWLRVSRGFPLSRERDGQVCPDCLGVPATDAGMPRCCRRAPRGWSADTYRAYWEAVRNGEVVSPKQWSSAEPAPAGGLSAWKDWMPGTATAFLVAMGLLQTGMTPLVMGSGLPTDVVSWIILLAPRFFVGYGLDIAGRGAGFMRLGSRGCAKCHYPLAGSPSERCPECGHAWRLPRGSVSTGRVVRWQRIVVGLCISILAAVAWWNAATGGAGWLRQMQSNAGLIAAAALNGPSRFVESETAWRELARRTLTAQEESALFDALLDARRQSSFMSTAPRTWVQAFLAAGKASPAQALRWRRESFLPELSAPDSARVGEPITVRISGSRVEELLPPAMGVTVHIGSTRFEGDAPSAPIGGPGAWSLELFQGKVTPQASLTSTITGDRELVVTVWLIARQYGHLQKPIQWNPDGTPILPADALWGEAHELRHRITIEP